MIDKNKQYKTRDGREVRIYATDAGGPYPVHGAIRDCGVWALDTWKENGNNFIGRSPNDLIEVKPKHKVKVWFYRCSDGMIVSYTYPIPNPLAIVEVPFEEGQGL